MGKNKVDKKVTELLDRAADILILKMEGDTVTVEHQTNIIELAKLIYQISKDEKYDKEVFT